MTTSIKAFAISAAVISVALLQEYHKEMKAINEKFEIQKDSEYHTMNTILIKSDSVKQHADSSPVIVNNTAEEKLILDFTTK